MIAIHFGVGDCRLARGERRRSPCWERNRVRSSAIVLQGNGYRDGITAVETGSLIGPFAGNVGREGDTTLRQAESLLQKAAFWS